MSFSMAAAAKQQALLRFFLGFLSAAQRADRPDLLLGEKVIELQGFGTSVVTAYRALSPESGFHPAEVGLAHEQSGHPNDVVVHLVYSDVCTSLEQTGGSSVIGMVFSPVVIRYRILVVGDLL